MQWAARLTPGPCSGKPIVRKWRNCASPLRWSVASQRLTGLRSMGIGGHIDIDDLVVVDGTTDFEATLLQAARREFEEELGVAAPAGLKIDGFMLDWTDVGKTHLGILIIIDLNECNCEELWSHANPSVDEMLDISWQPPALIWNDGAKYESWSVAFAQWSVCSGRVFNIDLDVDDPNPAATIKEIMKHVSTQAQ